MSFINHCLRPTLRLGASRPCTAAAAASYLRFYGIFQGLAFEKDDTNITAANTSSPNDLRTEATARTRLNSKDKRYEALRSSQDPYPRLSPDATAKIWPTRAFLSRFDSLKKDKTFDSQQAALHGRFDHESLRTPIDIPRQGQVHSDAEH